MAGIPPFLPPDTQIELRYAPPNFFWLCSTRKYAFRSTYVVSRCVSTISRVNSRQKFMRRSKGDVDTTCKFAKSLHAKLQIFRSVLLGREIIEKKNSNKGLSSSTICTEFLAKVLTYHRYYSSCTKLNLECSTLKSTLLMKCFDEYYTCLCAVYLGRAPQMLMRCLWTNMTHQREAEAGLTWQCWGFCLRHMYFGRHVYI